MIYRCDGCKNGCLFISEQDREPLPNICPHDEENCPHWVEDMSYSESYNKWQADFDAIKSKEAQEKRQVELLESILEVLQRKEKALPPVQFSSEGEIYVTSKDAVMTAKLLESILEVLHNIDAALPLVQ